ncbi:MAG TPA: hypothetical protein VIN61_07500 [Gammaproteobacteria bacterium]
MRPLTTDVLRALLDDAEPPCVSLYQPTIRTHPERQQNAIRYRNLLRSMERSLTDKYPARAVRPLLERFQALAEDNAFWTSRTEGLAILASPARFDVFDLQRSVPERVVVADSFHLKPLLRVVQSADRYHMLGLTRGAVKLYEGNRDVVDEVELEGVPATIEEALGTEHTERSESFWSVGPFHGRKGGIAIHMGSGQRKDDVGIDAERFFRAVDRAILERYSRPSGLPLLLVGLPENLAVFREVTRNPQVMDVAIEVDPDSLTREELRTRAWREIEPFYLGRLEELTDRYRLERSRGLGGDDLEEIARAAVAGRVDTLLVEAERFVPGRIDPDTGDVAEGDDSATDDLLDDLAETVLRMKGEAIVVPAERMPSDTGAAAIYRF